MSVSVDGMEGVGKVTREAKGVKVACPLCGKALPLRIVSLQGRLRCTILCKSCKQLSEVEIKDIRQGP